MTTKTIPTHELTAAALDWAVAHALGLTKHRRFAFVNERGDVATLDRATCLIDSEDFSPNPFSPSQQWTEAGPIIERQGISLRPIRKPGHTLDGQWLAHIDHGSTGNLVQWVEFLFGNRDQRRFWKGDTALQAAMRCYVASKLGPSVNVPQELQP